MRRLGRGLGLLLLAALVCAPAVGCFGISTNPSYFPYILPFEDIITTHDKPIWPGNDANFDPKAAVIVLQPVEQTNRVRTQHVLLATVYDAKGNPLRNRTVKWEVEGVGSIVEVDSEGVVPGRGHNITDKYAVSYTRWCERRITRGNANGADDFMVRPGQTYCVVTSPIEGDTHVTAYAPGIFDWDKRVVHATVRWADVHWEFPPRAVARYGTEYPLVTKVLRFTDRRPLQGYEVRYRILDGPPAGFLPNRSPEFIARSNADGDAVARIVQTQPGPGVNRIAIDVLRPPDPTTPSGSVVPIASGETSVEWLAPSIALSHTAPPAVALNREVTFTTVVMNTGRIESRGITVKLPIPQGLQFVRDNPEGYHGGTESIWTLAVLAPGQSYTIQTTYLAKRVGPVTSLAVATTAENLQDQKQITIQVTQPDLALDVQGPASAVLNIPVKFTITLRNPGSAVLENVLVEADFADGLEFAADPKTHRLTLGLNGPPINLAPQQVQTVDLELIPRQAGSLPLKVTAKADGLARDKTIVVAAQAPKMSLDVIEGPQKRFAGRPGEWKIRVTNDGDVPLTNVTVRDRLPPELEFEAASDNGQAAPGEVTWNLGTLAPRSQRIVVLRAKATRPAAQAVQIIAASADPGLAQQMQKGLEILGLGALGTNLTDLVDPIEAGKVEKYQFEITNTGSAPITNIVVRATATAELKPLSAAGPNGSAGQVLGQAIAFGKLDALAPGAKMVYTFEAETLKAGDARFEVEVTSDLNPEAIRLQESTRIVSPLPPPAPPPPPPAAK